MRRRHGIFLNMVEAAAMHLPSAAEKAGLAGVFAAERIIERHEIERGPDPSDRDDQVRRAQQQIDPFP